MSFQIQNKWRHGLANFAIPPLEECMGMRDGLTPLPAILDPEIGEEIALFLRDQTPMIEDIIATKPFRLRCDLGCAKNQYGPIAFALFWIEDPVQPERAAFAWECFINPNSAVHMGVWHKLAAQSHWHLFVVGEGGRQREFYEFENVFKAEQTLRFISETSLEFPTLDFVRACQMFGSQHSTEDMFRLKYVSHETASNWRGTVIHDDETITISIPREDVEKCSVAPLLSVLHEYLDGPETLAVACGRITLNFSGFENAREEVFTVPAVRMYMHALDEQFPVWPLLGNPKDGKTLTTIALCLCTFVRTSQGTAPDGVEFKRLLMTRMVQVFKLSAQYGLSDQITAQTCESVMRLFRDEKGWV